MGSLRAFRVTATSTRPVEEVWNLLADGAGWSRWAPFSRSELAREGSPAPDGVGAVRRFGTGPVTSSEEVVAFDPPRHLAYRLIAGLPVRGYRADVELEPTASGGTSITWMSSWGGNPPPTAFWRWLLRTSVRRIARALARA